MGNEGLSDARLRRHTPQGTLFDPVVGDAALECFEDFRLPLPREISSFALCHEE